MKSYLLLFLLPIAANAALFRAESESFTSARNNDQKVLEVPFYEYISSTYTNDKRDFEVNTYFNIFTDPTRAASNKANLYIFDAKFAAVPDLLNFRIGRSFDTYNTIGAASIDAISAELLFFERQLKFATFVGVERKPETGTPNPSANVWGARADFHTADKLPLFLATKFEQRRNITIANSIENLAQFSTTKTFATAWSPEFILDSQTNISRSNLDRLETGIDLYPSLNSFLKIRGLTYDVLPDTGVEQPIYSIFSVGRLFEGRLQLEQKIRRDLIMSISFFYDNYLYQTTRRTNGYGAEWESKVRGDGFNLRDTIYYFRSYGGEVYGNRVHLEKQTFKNHELYGSADVTYYHKITSSKRFATSSELGWGTLLSDRFKLNIAGELNSNNVLRYDLRAIAKLTYLLWSEI